MGLTTFWRTNHSNRIDSLTLNSSRQCGKARPPVRLWTSKPQGVSLGRRTNSASAELAVKRGLRNRAQRFDVLNERAGKGIDGGFTFRLAEKHQKLVDAIWKTADKLQGGY